MEVGLPAFEDELRKLGFSPLRSLRRAWRKITKTQSNQEKFLDEHNKSPDWDKFHDSLADTKFRNEVRLHPDTDPKLRRFIDAMGGFHSGRYIAHVPGESGHSYELRELKGGRIGCSCKDWRYSRSHKGEDCKHIRKHKESS